MALWVTISTGRPWKFFGYLFFNRFWCADTVDYSLCGLLLFFADFSYWNNSLSINGRSPFSKITKCALLLFQMLLSLGAINVPNVLTGSLVFLCCVVFLTPVWLLCGCLILRLLDLLWLRNIHFLSQVKAILDYFRSWFFCFVVQLWMVIWGQCEAIVICWV